MERGEMKDTRMRSAVDFGRPKEFYIMLDGHKFYPINVRSAQCVADTVYHNSVQGIDTEIHTEAMLLFSIDACPQKPFGENYSIPLCMVELKPK
jgi:hypothetical protein